MKEVPVPGYEGLYSLRDTGECINLKKNRPLMVDSSGCVSLRKGVVNVGHNLARMIYTAFVDPNYDLSKRSIRFRDGNKRNCSLDNITCDSLIPDLPGEIWKEIEHPSVHDYSVSNLGRVKNHKTDELISVSKQSKNSANQISLAQNSFRVEELVADAFLGRCEAQVVTHIDGDVSNDCASNLTLDAHPSCEDGELWKYVAGYSGRYMISSHGRLYTVPRKEHRGKQILTIRGRFLTSTPDEDGYFRTTLTKDKVHQDFFIHRLVATAFIPNHDNLPCINHIDGNKKNNHVENLEWCTNDYNVEHSVVTGLRDDMVHNNPYAQPVCVVLSDGTEEKFDSMKQAAHFFDVDQELFRLWVRGVYRNCRSMPDGASYYLLPKGEHRYRDKIVQDPNK